MVKRLMWSGLLAGLGALSSIVAHRVAGDRVEARVRRGAAGVSETRSPPPGEQRPEPPQNIATAIAEVSERATLLVREEIELAKAEVTEKATKLVRGAVVGVAAGVFFVMALVFALVGCAWLLYYYLPGNDFTYFWGFFAMAVILRRARRARRPDRRARGQTSRAAGAEHGDRGGAQDPRDGERGGR